ncbi:MAG: hypothetical protein JNJ58_12545 [Chitinophagaceae bacterium]|nr:hypothetical protein [Chitinophagaceae bacterium]
MCFLLLCFSPLLKAQYAFELTIDYAMRIQNSDQFSVSGVINKGRVESGKTYYLETGEKIVVTNVISAKTATSVPAAGAPEGVSIGITCKEFSPERGTVLKAVSNRGMYSGNTVRTFANQLSEGELSCKVNGRLYSALSVSKPVRVKSADVLDLFFEAEDHSVIWLQLNDFSQIEMFPHHAKTDTSNKDRRLVCRVVYMPEGYRPTDMPNNFAAYEDVKGNAGIVVTSVDKYHKKMSLEFSGILRANNIMLEKYPEAGLFYLTEGRVDHIGWDDF